MAEGVTPHMRAAEINSKDGFSSNKKGKIISKYTRENMNKTRGIRKEIKNKQTQASFLKVAVMTQFTYFLKNYFGYTRVNLFVRF